MWQACNRDPSPALRSRYKELSSECKSAIYKFALAREHSIVSRGNVGSFYRYANSRFCCKSAVGLIADSNGQLVADSTARANILHQTFLKNFSADNNIIPCSVIVQPFSGQLCNILFTPNLVRRAIKRLKSNSTGGPDGVPPSLFTNCCEELCFPLSLFFTFCFNHNVIPTEWLYAYIVPLFKKGDATIAQNYRPVALTATMSKIMESIIKDQMLQFLMARGLLSNRQHAFLKLHSTATNLLESVHDWAVGLNSLS